MTHKNINVDHKLKGQYRFSVLDSDKVVYSIPWCNNTILSGGLVDLYSYDIPTILSYLDIGTSNSLPGISGYGLSGVITGSEFSNVKRDIIESYNDSVSSRLYVVSFTTKKAISSFKINEFAVKRDIDYAFARNVFTSPVSILSGQYVNFEYRLSILWGSTYTGSMKLKGNSTSYTYSIPVTSTTYNIPYDGVYYNNNYLALVNKIYANDGITEEDIIPAPGSNYPINYSWGIGSVDNSVYAPTQAITGIDNKNRLFTVSTRYDNIQCAFDQDNLFYSNYVLLVKDGDLTIPTNKFNITKFAYPLISFNNNVVCLSTTPSNPVYNLISLGYNYTWSECSDIQPAAITNNSLFLVQPPYTFIPVVSSLPVNIRQDAPVAIIPSPTLQNIVTNTLGLPSVGLPIFLIPLQVNGSIAANNILNLTVSVSGAAPISYKWYKDNRLITNILSSYYVDSNVLPSESGKYTVVATNSLGSITGTSTIAVDITKGVTYNLSSNKTKFVLTNFTSLSTTNAGYSAVNTSTTFSNITGINLSLNSTYYFSVTGLLKVSLLNYNLGVNGLPVIFNTSVADTFNNNIQNGIIRYKPTTKAKVALVDTTHNSILCLLSIV